MVKEPSSRATEVEGHIFHTTTHQDIMKLVDIGFIICTHNRSKSLKRTLDSVAELSTPSNLKREGHCC